MWTAIGSVFALAAWKLYDLIRKEYEDHYTSNKIIELYDNYEGVLVIIICLLCLCGTWQISTWVYNFCSKVTIGWN
jgi:hypothetical protein